jgi:hypothetical protein
MEFPVKKIILILSLMAFFAGGHSAGAGNPIGDFFKRLGDSLAHPRSTPSPRRKAQKNTIGKKRTDNAPAAPQDTPPAEPTVPPSPTPSPMRQPMPVPQMVRAADGVAPSKRSRRDLPYGIPVPNKAGFVTSPYAPKAGYVDVRNFPSGTEVKDPYTGKTFLTP